MRADDGAAAPETYRPQQWPVSTSDGNTSGNALAAAQALADDDFLRNFARSAAGTY